MKNENVKQLLRIMRMSEEQYTKYVFEIAEQWLHSATNDDEWAISHLLKTKLFWAWWQLQWERRENSFCQIHQIHKLECDDDTQEIINDLWHELHSIEQLNIRPCSIVMEASYRQMMQELVGADERKRGGVHE